MIAKIDSIESASAVGEGKGDDIADKVAKKKEERDDPFSSSYKDKDEKSSGVTRVKGTSYGNQDSEDGHKSDDDSDQDEDGKKKKKKKSKLEEANECTCTDDKEDTDCPVHGDHVEEAIHTGAALKKYQDNRFAPQNEPAKEVEESGSVVNPVMIPAIKRKSNARGGNFPMSLDQVRSGEIGQIQKLAGIGNNNFNGLKPVTMPKGPAGPRGLNESFGRAMEEDQLDEISDQLANDTYNQRLNNYRDAQKSSEMVRYNQAQKNKPEDDVRAQAVAAAAKGGYVSGRTDTGDFEDPEKQKQYQIQQNQQQRSRDRVDQKTENDRVKWLNNQRLQQNRLSKAGVAGSSANGQLGNVKTGAQPPVDPSRNQYNYESKMEEEQVDEVAAPGQQDWVKANKERFIKQYGKEKGMSTLYATAWKRHYAANENKNLEECYDQAMMAQPEETGMNINSSMDTKTGSKSLTVSAQGQAAEELAQILKLSGLLDGGASHEMEPEVIDIELDEYANEPNPITQSAEVQFNAGNDLNRKKHSQTVGAPVAIGNLAEQQKLAEIERRLMAQLNELKVVSKKKLPSMAHIEKMCKKGMSVAEICKMHPDCDRAELKQMVADCKKTLDEANTESKKEFLARQARLAAASAETAKDPARLKRMMNIPGYSAAMDLAKKADTDVKKSK